MAALFRAASWNDAEWLCSSSKAQVVVRGFLNALGAARKYRCFNDSDLWIYELIRLLKLQPKSSCLMGNIVVIPALLKTNEDPQRQSWRWCSFSKGGIWTRSLEGLWSRNCVSMPVSLVVVRPLSFKNKKSNAGSTGLQSRVTQSYKHVDMSTCAFHVPKNWRVHRSSWHQIVFQTNRHSGAAA